MSDELTKYTVEVKYTFHVKAKDDDDAKWFADSSIMIVHNPQTGERIDPEIEAYQET